MTIILCFGVFVSITTNFISNNACAVLFSPIAIEKENGYGSKNFGNSSYFCS